MPAQRDPGPSVKDKEMYEALREDKEMYEALREDGASKEKAARISNAAANTSRAEVGRKGGKSGDYEDWTTDDLRNRAKEIGIKGRGRIKKEDLIKALRNH